MPLVDLCNDYFRATLLTDQDRFQVLCRHPREARQFRAFFDRSPFILLQATLGEC